MKGTFSILYCIPSLANTGGTEKVLCSKANYFADVLGYNVTILVSQQNNRPLNFYISPKVKVIDLNINQYTSDKIKGLSFIRNIHILKRVYEKQIDELKPDIIIVVERGYEDFIIPSICKKVAKIREYHFSKKASKSLEKQLPFLKRLKNIFVRKLYHGQFKKYNCLVVLTEKDKASWLKIKNIEVIPNMSEESNRKSNGFLERPKKAISVGSMYEDRKGFSSLIKIWAQIIKDQKEWTLHIYGDGPYKSIYKKQVKELGLENNIFLEGISNEMNNKYRDSQLFLFTSKGEGLPMVLIEAHKMGIPVVTYDCYCGPSDIIQNEYGGYLIAMNDEKDFLDKTYLLLRDDDLRKQKSDEAYDNSKRYNVENIIPLWEHLFKKLLNN